MTKFLLSFLVLYLQLTTNHLSFTLADVDSIDAVNALDHILNAESDPIEEDTSSSTEDTRSLEEQLADLKEPDFMLIGVVKSGSTSLYHYMVQHPEISGVESSYLLPLEIRNKISNIIKLRHRGKLPRISKPRKPKAQQIFDANIKGPQKMQTLTVGNTIKDNIYEINNFDLARMIKPIIDQKEIRFFDSFWYNHLQSVTNHSLQLAWKWYLQCFNQDPDASDKLLRGEASPTYFASSQFTAERIKLWLPNIKLILLLRNPVRRFVSHLKMIKENHAANMRFRKIRQMEVQNKKRNQTQYTLSADIDVDMEQNGIDLSGIRRRLLEMEEMEQMGQYNPFNNPFNSYNPQDVPQFNAYNNVPFAPQTRYGSRFGKRRPSGFRQNRLIRTRPNPQMMNMNPRYNQLMQQYQDMLAQQQQQFGGGGWIDGDDPIDDQIINELNEDDFDTEHESQYAENTMYINQEIDYNEKKRPGTSKQIISPSTNTAKQPPKKPVNKMEKIIGAIYKLSMYQVILVSNANPDSQAFYRKRWGVARDVAGFINRLLFGGIYTMRMKEWLKRFDSDHLFYRESNRLFDDPVGLMKELEEYLGVTPLGDEKWGNITKKVYNVNLETYGKGYEHKVQDADDIEHWDITVDKETKIQHPTEQRKWKSLEIINMLRDYYRPHNTQLSELFDGVKYKDWDY